MTVSTSENDIKKHLKPFFVSTQPVAAAGATSSGRDSACRRIVGPGFYIMGNSVTGCIHLRIRPCEPVPGAQRHRDVDGNLFLRRCGICVPGIPGRVQPCVGVVVHNCGNLYGYLCAHGRGHGRELAAVD